MPQIFSAVKAVIKDNDKILVLRQVVDGKTLWDLPGGRMEYGETLHEALHREVFEETQTSVTIQKPLGAYHFFRIIDKHQVICNTFLCTLKGGSIDITKNPCPEEGINAFEWVTLADFLSDEYVVSDASMKELLKSSLNQTF